MVKRLASRTTNSYGKQPDEVARILHLKQTVELVEEGRRPRGRHERPSRAGYRECPPADAAARLMHPKAHGSLDVHSAERSRASLLTRWVPSGEPGVFLRRRRVLPT